MLTFELQVSLHLKRFKMPPISSRTAGAGNPIEFADILGNETRDMPAATANFTSAQARQTFEQDVTVTLENAHPMPPHPQLPPVTRTILPTATGQLNTSNLQPIRPPLPAGHGILAYEEASAPASRQSQPSRPQVFGIARRIGGGQMATTWEPSLVLTEQTPTWLRQIERLFAELDLLLSPLLTPSQHTPTAADDHLLTMRISSSPSLLEPTAGVAMPNSGAADPYFAVVASSLQLYGQEQERQLARVSAAHTCTVAALREAIDQIRCRPRISTPGGDAPRLHAGDFDGFEARVTYRLPAIVFARRLVTLWRTGTTGLEVLDETAATLSMVQTALQRALATQTPLADEAAVAQLATQAEACIDGGACDNDSVGHQLAACLLTIAHQLPPDLLSELLRQATMSPGRSL